MSIDSARRHGGTVSNFWLKQSVGNICADTHIGVTKLIKRTRRQLNAFSVAVPLQPCAVLRTLPAVLSGEYPLRFDALLIQIVYLCIKLLNGQVSKYHIAPSIAILSLRLISKAVDRAPDADVLAARFPLILPQAKGLSGPQARQDEKAKVMQVVWTYTSACHFGIVVLQGQAHLVHFYS